MRARNDEHSDRDWLALQERALAVAAEGITIADARLPDRPLIYVNEGFERLTGYAAAEVLGRNCRFLQGPDTDADTVQVMRQAMQHGRECTVEILNRRKDGTPFWNRLSISPVRDGAGTVTHYIGVQSDVTARREAEDGLRRANLQMRRDLEEAAAIQQAWLPRALPRVPGYEFAWRFRPCAELAGDGLDVVRLDDDHVGVYILDVCGHGVPAALLSASLNRLLSPLPEQSCLFVPAADGGAGFAPAAPAVVAGTLNRQFRAGPETGKFFTILYGVLELQSRTFRYMTAGHPPPVRISAAGVTVCPLAHGVPIGILADFAYKEKTVHLEPGDRLLMYTDGAFEAIDGDDQELGENRLFDALAELHGLAPGASLDAMIARIEAWCPEDQPQDDVTLLSIDVLRP
ncbi:MAG: PP2C family protein-serine/threonine phosphatase [Candidatus Krumholzibacteriia bacterium]